MGRAARWTGHGEEKGREQPRRGGDLTGRGFPEREIGLLSSGAVETVIL